jgi:hypothetical protein
MIDRLDVIVATYLRQRRSLYSDALIGGVVLLYRCRPRTRCEMTRNKIASQTESQVISRIASALQSKVI